MLNPDFYNVVVTVFLVFVGVFAGGAIGYWAGKNETIDKHKKETGEEWISNGERLLRSLERLSKR